MRYITHQNDIPFRKRDFLPVSDPDTRSLQIGENADRHTEFRRNLPDPTDDFPMPGLFPMREIETSDVHSGNRKFTEGFLGFRRGADGRDDFCMFHRFRICVRFQYTPSPMK